jgi:hypothetical protein
MMTAVRPHKNVRGREFVDCVQVSYLFGGWPLEVNVLLDGAHPGATPAPLPALRALVGHRGVFEGPGLEAETVARRIPGAWILVARGESLKQRLAALEHLSITLRL